MLPTKQLNAQMARRLTPHCFKNIYQIVILDQTNLDLPLGNLTIFLITSHKRYNNIRIPNIFLQLTLTLANITLG